MIKMIADVHRDFLRARFNSSARKCLHSSIKYHIYREKAGPLRPAQLTEVITQKSQLLEAPAAPALRDLARISEHQVAQLVSKVEVPAQLYVLVKSKGEYFSGWLFISGCALTGWTDIKNLIRA
jgi:hypothetical protein